MAVNFKFRSSVYFDSIPIDGPSISVAELKVCGYFDLVVFHARTGEVFEEKHHQIPSGAKVILKRVPAPQANEDDTQLQRTANNGLMKCGDPQYSPGTSPSSNVDMDNFDDFGTDLFIAPTPSCLDLGFDEEAPPCGDIKQKPETTERFWGEFVSGFENVEAGKDKDHRDLVEEANLKMNLTAMLKKNVQTDEAVYFKPVDKISSWKHDVDFPSELKCSLCQAIFEEAVMIPCCQHSFCEKCISLALREKAKCPQCLSSGCKVDDLLPNVSLRQAIERFLDSQLINSLGSAPNKYPPDDESAVQVKESSFAVSIHKLDTQGQHSPATGKGSNHVCAESVCESLVREKGPLLVDDLHNRTKGRNADIQICGTKGTKNVKIDALPTKLTPSLLQKEEDGSVTFASSSRNRKVYKDSKSNILPSSHPGGGEVDCISLPNVIPNYGEERRVVEFHGKVWYAYPSINFTDRRIVWIKAWYPSSNCQIMVEDRLRSP